MVDGFLPWGDFMLRFKRKGPPEHQLKPTYENELRAMGRYCDDNELRDVAIIEVEDGFILRAFANGNDPTCIEAIEVPKNDIESLIHRNYSNRGSSRPSQHHSPICPTGYEDFLRAVGHELEVNKARGVAIQEMTEKFAVTYKLLQAAPEDAYLWETRSVLLAGDDIEKLLEQASGRREIAS